MTEQEQPQQQSPAEGAGTARDFPGPAPKRVAVLAVHGISDQKPFATARAIAGLLMNTECNKEPLYGSAVEHSIDLRIRGVQLGPDPMSDLASAAQRDTAPQPFKRFVEEFQKWRRRKPNDPVAAWRDPGHAFLHGQVSGYQGEDAQVPFETVRLETWRRAGNNVADVHVYEMYWADLSRLGEGWVRVLGEFYQILMHLGSVGVHTLRAAATERLDGRWAAEVKTASLASWALAVPIALANLLMFLLAVALVILGRLSTAHDPAQRRIFAGALLIGLLGAPAFGLFKRISIQAFLGVALATVAGAALLFFTLGNRAAVVGNVTLVLGITGYVYWQIVSAYDRVRPGAKFGGLWLCVLAVAGFIFSLFKGGLPVSPGSSVSMGWEKMAPVALMRLFETTFWIAYGSWLFFYFALLSTAILAVLCLSRRPMERRALYTGLLCLSLPAILFGLVTIVIWILIGQTLRPVLPDGLPQYVSMLGWGCYGLADYAKKLLEEASSLLPYFSLLLALLAGCGIVGVLPAVLSEEKTARGANDITALGRWLSGGLGLLQAAGGVLILGIAVVLPVLLAAALVDLVLARLGVIDLHIACRLSQWSTDAGSLVTEGIGQYLAGSAIGLFALSRWLELFSGCFIFLDPVLDVDNYLREHPRASNPTARIFARYVSLLRYICEWTDAGGNKYDKLVIISHSQGTVITADLLRYLRTSALALGIDNYEKELRPILDGFLPVCLFTMGSPLRQLYAPMFPHLYSYVGVLEGSRGALTPGELGLTRWTNAFRSGDYVGRHLWNPAAGPVPWPGGSRPWDVCGATSRAGQAVNREDLPVGFGAHNHYWDISAPAIAVELDRLIR